MKSFPQSPYILCCSNYVTSTTPLPPPKKEYCTLEFFATTIPFCVCVLVPSLYLDLICQRLVVTISYLPNQAKIYLTFWQGFREEAVEALKKKETICCICYIGRSIFWPGSRNSVWYLSSIPEVPKLLPDQVFFFHLIGTDRARNLMLPLHAKSVSMFKRFRFLHLPSTHEQKTHYSEFFVEGVN